VIEEERERLVQRALARIELETRRVDERCARDPLYWLQNHTQTENERHLERGVPFRQPFPKKRYFEVLMRYMRNEKRLFIAKSREMMTSWLAMGFATHHAQWQQGALVLVQTEKEDKVKALIRYCSILYHNQESWLKERHLLAGESTTEISWANRSRIIGVPKGEHQVRLYHPTLYIIDEAAFLPEFRECYNAAHPVAGQIIAISSAAPGPFGEECER
jgi:hypothetical protein